MRDGAEQGQQYVSAGCRSIFQQPWCMDCAGDLVCAPPLCMVQVPEVPPPLMQQQRQRPRRPQPRLRPEHQAASNTRAGGAASTGKHRGIMYAFLCSVLRSDQQDCALKASSGPCLERSTIACYPLAFSYSQPECASRLPTVDAGQRQSPVCQRQPGGAALLHLQCAGCRGLQWRA